MSQGQAIRARQELILETLCMRQQDAARRNENPREAEEYARQSQVKNGRVFRKELDETEDYDEINGLNAIVIY